MHAMNDTEEIKINLTSPTSSHMKNSFIIKNASKNMDQMYKQLKLKQRMSSMALLNENTTPAINIEELKSATLKKQQSLAKR